MKLRKNYKNLTNLKINFENLSKNSYKKKLKIRYLLLNILHHCMEQVHCEFFYHWEYQKASINCLFYEKIEIKLC